MPTNASPRLRERERLPGGQEARWIERGALDLLYSTAQAGSGAPTEQAGGAGLGWLGLQSAVCSVPEDSVPFGRGPAGCGAAAKESLVTSTRRLAESRRSFLADCFTWRFLRPVPTSSAQRTRVTPALSSCVDL